MKTTISGNDRRKQILSLIRRSKAPVSGTALGQTFGVSRQVIVQDIALLRKEGYDIFATARGYMVNESKPHVRLVKVRHTEDESEDEMDLIVDLGGCVEDVMVNHRIYGQMSASLNIRNRRDVRHFMEDLRSGRSTPLMNITSGYHFHHISADAEEVLDEIEAALRERNFLVEMIPYEQQELAGIDHI
ncbi:MAG: transcription repressor NadR [Clostridiales bacterium]|nr:transcription repressor NadR [Clostridiales bacterium]